MGKKPTSKKGGGKREEHTAAISSQVYGLVKNYKIDGGDNVLPKISGVLRATGALVHELLQEVKEAHLTHGLADDLFYASMLIENEAKETLKNFMIKSSKGKADQEDKVLSLQKLYVMNAGGGFLAKVEHVKPRVLIVRVFCKPSK